jgi:hypothetical protein
VIHCSVMYEDLEVLLLLYCIPIFFAHSPKLCRPAFATTYSPPTTLDVCQTRPISQCCTVKESAVQYSTVLYSNGTSCTSGHSPPDFTTTAHHQNTLQYCTVQHHDRARQTPTRIKAHYHPPSTLLAHSKRSGRRVVSFVVDFFVPCSRQRKTLIIGGVISLVKAVEAKCLVW